MNVLILGSGGREHAIAWKLKQSKAVNKLFVAPGNAGTFEISENLDLSVYDFEGIKKAVIDLNIDMVVVGPEDPLVNGIVDYFRTDEQLKNKAIIGPSAKAAVLEGSKDYAKQFMIENNIPTAKYKSFEAHEIQQGFDFIDQLSAPFVLKADGLAAGKGVLILKDADVAKIELRRMLEDHKFGKASSKVVIEEFLSGIEISVFVLTDGQHYKILPNAKDYKRIGEGDTGLNTGGMGAVSPVPFATKEFIDKVEKKIIQPTIAGIKKENMDYKGFIFFGLMVVNNEPFVIEYNVRLGDPETEVILPRIKSDLLDLFTHVNNGTLNEAEVEFDNRATGTIMMVSGGYPDNYEKGKKILGLEGKNGSIIFHAGTKRDGAEVVTNGGRVIAVTSFGENIHQALKHSYERLKTISFDKHYYRNDIGFDL